MKGHVPTPDELAERMVRRLFRERQPTSDDRILYPGSGSGPFAAAVERVCASESWPLPSGYAVEQNPDHLADARERGLEHVTFHQRDFLADDMLEAGRFDYIVGNPPYVPIEGLDDEEKRRYKAAFSTAAGRFDLYLLFFERALDLLAPGGRLSFVTPEKWEYVGTAAPLRRLLSADDVHVEEVDHLDEDSFTGLITFPCVTTIRRGARAETQVRLRDGTTHTTMLPENEDSWASSIRGTDLSDMNTGVTLGDVTVRISAGVATGADSTFVMNRSDVPDWLDAKWIRPTVSGRELSANDSTRSDSVFVCPYSDDGGLVPEEQLGTFGEWAKQHRKRLKDRYCVKEGGKKWYAWHENPPMWDILQPKVIFKDIASEPRFWAERKGDVVPRHSVYYLVPEKEVSLDDLLDYLHGVEARQWMEANCQRAANGFMRLQSRVLRDLPVPKGWRNERQIRMAL
jgi:SAM-dependent methyltransferase